MLTWAGARRVRGDHVGLLAQLLASGRMGSLLDHQPGLRALAAPEVCAQPGSATGSACSAL
ncbi:MAG TPA: hypothetical protein VEJ23_01475 [Solirubrobacteraceae bacterium]|nr:hypothetical protein [Solirubrobacteraceae bacterium]